MTIRPDRPAFPSRWSIWRRRYRCGGHWLELVATVTLLSMLEATYCRRRQMRLMQRMAEKNVGAICVGQRRHVYYLTGHWTQWTQRSAAIVFSDGQVWLTCAQEPDKNTAADQVVSYEAKWTSTLRQEQPAVVAKQVIEGVKGRGGRGGGGGGAVGTPGGGG